MGGAFLFVTWDGGGNVNPVLAMARGLLDRGHTVRVLGSASLGPRFDEAGVPFVAREASTEWDQSAAADDVIAEIARTATGAVIVDYMIPGALCGAEASGPPTAAFVHTLYGAMFVGEDLMTMYVAADLEGVNAVRDRLGLGQVARMHELVDRASIALVTSPRELDVAVEPLPVNVRYVGPVLETGDDGRVADPPDVVVSLGTTAMDETPLLQRILDAAAELPVRVWATVGDHVDAAAITAPPNATVTGYVPHASVLPGARLLVCHAGLGGVLAALAHGVPILCLPLGRDQPANAAAVERVGAGCALPPDASVEDIRAAMADLLERGAKDLSPVVAAYSGAWVKAIESLLRG